MLFARFAVGWLKVSLFAATMLVKNGDPVTHDQEVSLYFVASLLAVGFAWFHYEFVKERETSTLWP